MIISSSISTTSQNQSTAIALRKSASVSTENVSISIVGIHSTSSVSKTETKLLWGIEVSNDTAVIPSGESIIVQLSIDYEIYSPAKRNKVAYNDTTQYDITSLLGSVNVSTPVFSNDDSKIFLNDQVLTVTSKTISLVSPISTPHTAGGQTWNFTI